ncbi:CGNR zinc finger domain-containing protein [Mycolicibacterium baixiangningiae]|uniref:CGNR zinc finger domain-containing protein n=1 Tax=Mycolicibacterium baixiangningiae TaxID=2761578 RepID=UPI001866AB04|nr:CGNR zinc finger domain-containing protein [Mycolicibacterium baixiangningiae]
MSREPGQWTADNDTRPAPAPLDRVQSLVNTIDIEIGQDRLTRPEDARPWLIGRGLLGADAPLTDADLGHLRAVREALRALLVQNAGGPPPARGDVEVLSGVAAAGCTRAVIDDNGDVELRAVGESLVERLGELLVVIRDAQRDGSWARLKACANDDCRWAFYDQSRNRGGSWCDMAVCGNRLKNRDFRARHRAAQ